jgi:hypothetical protein
VTDPVKGISRMASQAQTTVPRRVRSGLRNRPMVRLERMIGHPVHDAPPTGSKGAL